MWDNCNPLDPDTLPVVTTTDIQGNIKFNSPQNTSYVVSDSPMVVDYRYHFNVDISAKMRDEDVTKLASIIRSVWNTTMGMFANSFRCMFTVIQCYYVQDTDKTLLYLRLV